MSTENILRAKFLWKSTIDHRRLRRFWKKEAWVRQLHVQAVPIERRGILDKRSMGRGRFSAMRKNRPRSHKFLFGGPWFHGSARAKGREHRIDSFRRARNGSRVRENIRPILPIILAGRREAGLAGQHFRAARQLHSMRFWLRKAQATIYICIADGTLSFRRARGRRAKTYRGICL